MYNRKYLCVHLFLLLSWHPRSLTCTFQQVKDQELGLGEKGPVLLTQHRFYRLGSPQSEFALNQERDGNPKRKRLTWSLCNIAVGSAYHPGTRGSVNIFRAGFSSLFLCSWGGQRERKETKAQEQGNMSKYSFSSGSREPRKNTQPFRSPIMLDELCCLTICRPYPWERGTRRHLI